MILFTIIIPHKNIPELLLRCLNTIPLRDDIQIVIVDDNSQLPNEEFDSFPGLDRPNTEVIFTKEGRGAGYARNVGLSHAQGEWIIFADADDVFTPSISELLDKLPSIEADVVYFKIESKDSETLRDNDESASYNEVLENAMISNADTVRYNIEVPWGKAIRRSFIERHQLQFEEVPCSNDTRFAVMCDFYAKKVEVLPMSVYCWMIRKNSLWHNRNLSWAETRFHVMMRLSSFMRKHKKESLMMKYREKGYHFLVQIFEFSKWTYLKNLFFYGLYIRSSKVLFYECPRVALHFIRKCIMR